MSGKKENTLEEFEKAFKYFLKEPVAKDSFQKYLLYSSGGAKNLGNSSLLQEKCNKFDETLRQSQNKRQRKNLSSDDEVENDVLPASLTLKKATGIAKKFAPQTCGVKFTKRQPVKQILKIERVKDSIESDFKTAREELQLQNLQSGKNTLSRQTSNMNSVQMEENDDLRTAREELRVQRMKRHASANSLQGAQRRRYLGGRRGVHGQFVSPVLSNGDIEEAAMTTDDIEEVIDERLKNIDPKMVQLILSEIMDSGDTISWEDIAGLEFAKNSIQEAVVWPMLRPDIFTGLRRPPKAILLFGPPGTGKTLIGKCVASQSRSTFFSISASSLTSKWIGDGEKMVRALFSVARCHQPAVIFIDEVDSLLSQRSDTEHECSRRMKTEFLVQLDGATTDSEERLLVIGATNRPQELDQAARRRFVKRLYIPLPVVEARRQLVQQLMKNENHQLTEEDVGRIAELTDGYSGADMKNLCCEAALGPIRCIDLVQIETISAADVRPISMGDFENALQHVKSSVADKDLEQLITWNRTYGSNKRF